MLCFSLFLSVTRSKRKTGENFFIRWGSWYGELLKNWSLFLFEEKILLNFGKNFKISSNLLLKFIFFYFWPKLQFSDPKSYKVFRVPLNFQLHNRRSSYWYIFQEKEGKHYRYWYSLASTFFARSFVKKKFSEQPTNIYGIFLDQWAFLKLKWSYL